ncbi:MAG: proline dehydrogenase family protein [Anaerolineae bacterium]
MLRSLLLYLSEAPWARRLMMNWGVARRVALRFVAGEMDDQAVEAVRAVNQKGMTATLDLLGESVTDEQEARAMAASYQKLMSRVAAEQLDTWISVKLTALGLDISEALAHDNMRSLLDCARDTDLRVTIDMEGSDITQTTLDMFHALRAEGYDNVRAVIQAYLYRSDDDIAALAAVGAGVRLCKGAYNEPPEIAYPKKADVDEAYKRQTRVLLDAAAQGLGYPGIATHDEAMIEAAKQYAADHAIARHAYEFQKLYGVRTNLQEELAAAGYNVRVYVPFGQAWYPYFMRRLAERPANIWFFVSNFFKA